MYKQLIKLRLLLFVYAATIFSTTCTYAQVVERYHTLTDYRMATPRTMAVFGGHLFIGYDGGGVYEFDSTLTLIREIRELDYLYITDVFEHGEYLFAVAINGSVLARSSTSEKWEAVGDFDCPPFLEASGRITAINNGTVFELVEQDGKWQATAIGSVEGEPFRATAFATRGDTVIYSKVGERLITVTDLQHSFTSKIETSDPVSLLWEIGDGSIVVHTENWVAGYINPASLRHPALTLLRYGAKLLALENVQQTRYNGEFSVVGRASALGPSAKAGVFEIRGADSIAKISELSDRYEMVYACTRNSSGWVYGTNTLLARLDGDGTDVQRKWFGDTLITSHSLIISNDHHIVETGSIDVEKKQFPAILPTTVEGSGLKVIELDSPTIQPLISYHEYSDGSKIAFLSEDVYHYADGLWHKVHTMPSIIKRKDIEYPNDSVVICKGDLRHILISRDRGASWIRAGLPAKWILMDDVKLADDRYYGRSYGTVFTVALDSLQDTISPKYVNIQPGSYIRFVSGNDQRITIIAGKSFTDPAFNPMYLTHVVYYDWYHGTGQFDSTVVELPRNISASMLQIMSKNDTTYYWSGIEHRMVALTRNGVVYDTTLAFPQQKNFEYCQTTASLVDDEGFWWLISEPRNLAVRINPSKAAPTSVQDYARIYIRDVYPNPATKTVRITLGRFPETIENNIKLFLTGLRGQQVRDFSHLVARFPSAHSTQEIELNVNGLTPGLYVLVVSNVQSLYTQKLLITN